MGRRRSQARAKRSNKATVGDGESAAPSVGARPPAVLRVHRRRALSKGQDMTVQTEGAHPHAGRRKDNAVGDAVMVPDHRCIWKEHAHDGLRAGGDRRGQAWGSSSRERRDGQTADLWGSITTVSSPAWSSSARRAVPRRSGLRRSEVLLSGRPRPRDGTSEP
mgnify:CR=1 FL=1